MPKERPEPPIVHLYAPRYPHDPVEIIGSPSGLERLIDALIAAIYRGQGAGQICTSGGHESDVRVTCLQGRRRPEEWLRSGSPYWDVDNPMIARLLDLTEENLRLRQMIATLRCERKSIINVDDHGGSEGTDGGPLPPA